MMILLIMITMIGIYSIVKNLSYRRNRIIRRMRKIRILVIAMKT